MTWLNLGVGASPSADPVAVNVDRHPYPGVQIVHDLDIIPWPFPDAAFTHVQAIQLFEHVHDPVGFMRESWRVLEPHGTLLIVAPYWKSENAFTDPTHVRFCTPRTWDYWIAETALNSQFGPAYADGRVFTSGKVEHRGDDLIATLTK